MSAERVCDARSIVREWQMVTVACSRRSSSAAGLPTTLLAADDDGMLALDVDPAPLEELDGGLRRGRQEAVVTLGQQAGVLRVEAVDVWRGRSRRRRPAT